MISIFRIGLILSIIGVVWISITFSDSEKISQTIDINSNHAHEIELTFSDRGIGYYKIFIPDFTGNRIFIQILDQKNNIISEKMIETKMSLNYFDFNQGEYTIRISNIAEQKQSLDVEFGNTGSEEMIYPGIMLALGVLLILIVAFNKMKNYNTAQPDENTL